MNPIQTILDEIFLDTDITPEEKASLMDIYVISLYKMLVELLTAIKGDKVEFHKSFNDFVTSVQATFSDQEKEDFEKILQKGQRDELEKILTVFKQNLPQDMQTKIEGNMKRIGLTS